MTELAKNDPWFDEDFQVPLDTRKEEVPFAEQLAKIADEEPNTPGLPAQTDIAAPPPVPPTPPAPPAPPKPEVMELAGGMTVSIEKTAGGWKAVLDANTGARPEIFEAKTKDDLLRQALVKGVHATKKINQLNRQVKLAQPAPEPQAAPQSGGRVLTADEQVAFNLEFKANPAAALEKWFGTRVGLPPEEVGKGAQRGIRADEELTAEGHAKVFLNRCPEYFPTDDNFNALVAYLTKNKLPFTADSLEQAFNDLSEAGLLEEREEEVPEVIPPAPPAAPPEPPVPAEPPANPRIASTTRAKRAAGSFGLTSQDSTPARQTQTDVNKAPSAEEIDNLTDDEVFQLFANTRRYAAQTRR